MSVWVTYPVRLFFAKKNYESRFNSTKCHQAASSDCFFKEKGFSWIPRMPDFISSEWKWLLSNAMGTQKSEN